MIYRHLATIILLLAGVGIGSDSGIYAADDCEAFFTYVPTPADSLTIQFLDASSSSSAITYLWEFGDNTTSNAQNPVHQYLQPGIYEVCLYISDATKSCFDIFCESVLVPVPTDCEASFSFIPDGANPFLYHFQSTTGSDIDSLWWSFGDGTTSTLPNPSHLYADTGTYIVVLNAKNTIASEVCWSVYTDTLICTIEPCISKFDILPHPINPFIYNFNSIGEGNINNYHWDFGDGRFSDLPNPVHTYEDTGTFIIKLFVSNIFAPDYCYDSSEQSIHITLIPCQSLFSFVQDTLNPLTFSFINQSSGPGDEWVWTFGDGTTSAEINPIHSYSDTGSFTVCLQIRNSQYPTYCNDIECVPINIADLTCSAEFTIERDTNNILAVRFIPVNLGPASMYEWSFGDDAISQLLKPLHEYSDTGWYQIKHYVTNPFFSQYCNNIVTDSIYLGFLQYPEANFSYTFDSLSLVPNLFHFTDRSAGTHLTNWKWSFGDGTLSPVQHPSHHYNATGTFTVCLEVADSIPPKYQLKNQYCNTLQTFRYFDLGGSVYDGAIPINNPDPEGDTAEVALFRLFDNDNIYPIATGLFSNLGYYYFQSILEGNYFVKANLTEQSRQAGKYFPTWSEEALTWTQARVIELNQNLFAENIHLQLMPVLPAGNYGIDGIVLKVNNPTATTGISTPGVTVYLTDIEGHKLRYNVSDVTGRFLFRDLPAGIYKLVADHPGYLSSTESVSLNAANPFGGNERIRIYQESAIGEDEPLDVNNLVLINNPFGDWLNLRLPDAPTEPFTIQLYNALGQPVATTVATEKAIQLPTKHLAKGLYLLHIQYHKIKDTVIKLIKN